MWLKFVKGFSLQEKCKFPAIKISILFCTKDCPMMNSLSYRNRHLSYYFTWRTERLWLKHSKLNFPWYFPIPEVPTPPKGK